MKKSSAARSVRSSTRRVIVIPGYGRDAVIRPVPSAARLRAWAKARGM